MPFTKGNKFGKGRVSQNKATQNFKEAVTNFIDYASPHFIEWLEQIDEPEARFRVVKDLAEYAFPKLARQEISGPDGGQIELGVTLTPEQRRQALKKLGI